MTSEYYEPSVDVDTSPFQPEKFNEQFEYYLKYSKSKVTQFRKIVTKQTYRAIESKMYLLPNGERVNLDAEDLELEVRRTDLYTEKILKRKQIFKDRHCSIEVTQKDYLQVAEEYHREGLVPLVVLGVHPVEPGGTYLMDGKIYSDGIEEDAYRRSTLYNALKHPQHKILSEEMRDWEYKIPEYGGIVCTHSYILRGTEEDGYPFLKNPVPVGFLLQTPMKKVKVMKAKKKQFREYEFLFDDVMLKEANQEKMTKKVKTLLDIALVSNHYKNDALVISPGFLSFHAPPFHVGTIIKEVVESNEYTDQFRRIIICTKENSEAKFNIYGQYYPLLYAILPSKENLHTEKVNEKKNPEKWGAYENKWSKNSDGSWKNNWSSDSEWKNESDWKGNYWKNDKWNNDRSWSNDGQRWKKWEDRGGRRRSETPKNDRRREYERERKSEEEQEEERILRDWKENSNNNRNWASSRSRKRDEDHRKEEYFRYDDRGGSYSRGNGEWRSSSSRSSSISSRSNSRNSSRNEKRRRIDHENRRSGSRHHQKSSRGRKYDSDDDEDDLKDLEEMSQREYDLPSSSHLRTRRISVDSKQQNQGFKEQRPYYHRDLENERKEIEESEEENYVTPDNKNINKEEEESDSSEKEEKEEKDDEEEEEGGGGGESEDEEFQELLRKNKQLKKDIEELEKQLIKKKKLGPLFLQNLDGNEKIRRLNGMMNGIVDERLKFLEDLKSKKKKRKRKKEKE